MKEGRGKGKKKQKMGFDLMEQTNVRGCMIGDDKEIGRHRTIVRAYEGGIESRRNKK